MRRLSTSISTTALGIPSRLSGVTLVSRPPAALFAWTTARSLRASEGFYNARCDLTSKAVLREALCPAIQVFHLLQIGNRAPIQVMGI